MRSPFLFFADDRLSEAELTAACLDGDLIELGGGYIPADAVETPALRAGSLTVLLGETLAATHLSAAWIHGALLVPPALHTVQRAVTQRLTKNPARHAVYRDSQVPASDLVRLGGVLVSSAERTLFDLVRTPGGEHVDAAGALASERPDAIAPAIARFDGAIIPYKRAALELLARFAEGQELVTR